MKPLILIPFIFSLIGCLSTNYNLKEGANYATLYTLDEGSTFSGANGTYVSSIDGKSLTFKGAQIRKHSEFKLNIPAGRHSVEIGTNYKNFIASFAVGMAAGMNAGVDIGANSAMIHQNALSNTSSTFKNGRKTFNYEFKQGEVYIFQPVLENGKVVDISIEKL